MKLRDMFLMRSPRWQSLTFLGGSLLILFFNLWGRTLENHDYLRYAEVAKEMIQTGDWIVPRLNGEIFIHKPPLLFWLIAIPSNLYGSVTPFLARLPSAFFAWIGGIVVYLWGRQILGDSRSGFISSGVLLSSYLYFWQGRIARTDMVFSVFVLLSLYFFYLGYQKRKVYLTGCSFAFIGLAGLTKGPVGLILPLSVAILFLITQRQLRQLVQRGYFLGYFILALILGLWLLPFLYSVGWDQTVEVWQTTRILTRHAPFYLYGLRIWTDFAPWSIFLPFMFFYYLKKERNRAELFLILWFISLFCLLTLFPFRASKYLLPAFPALALLTGGFWRNKSNLFFWIFFLGAILAWHGYEFRLIQGNEKRSPGIFIEKELKPFRKENLLAYQMDTDLLGKINFYGDPIIPQVRGMESLKRHIVENQEAFWIMPQNVFEDLIQEGFPILPLKIIEHKDIKLVAAKIQSW